MKPYLAQYFCSRDLEGFREILEYMVSPQQGDTRRVVFRCIELMIPTLRVRFPSISERKMIIMALDRVALLDIPADLNSRSA